MTSRRDAIEHEQVDPVAALEQWLEALSEYLTAFDGLPEPLRLALSEEASPLAITCEGFITTTDHFLAAAQRDGGAQPWIRARDLFLTVLATAWARGAMLADTSSAKALPAILRSGWVAPQRALPVGHPMVTKPTVGRCTTAQETPYAGAADAPPFTALQQNVSGFVNVG